MHALYCTVQDLFILVVWINWCPLDIILGAWLLDPDNVPSTFCELLARYGMQQLAPPPSPRGQVSCDVSVQHDLALLGPLMVKIYQQLQVYLPPDQPLVVIFFSNL